MLETLYNVIENKKITQHFSFQIRQRVNHGPEVLFPGLGVHSTSICCPSCSTCFLSERVALQEVHGPQHVSDLTTRIKLVMLIEQSPSVDGCVDTGAKILAEASIFRPFDAQLLSTPVLDFLAEAIKILDSREVTTSFCLWLVVHGVEKEAEEHEGTRHPGDVGGGDVWSSCYVGC